MPKVSFCLKAVMAASTMACLFSPASAQRLPAGTTVTSAAVTGLNQFDTGISGGGSFNWSEANANVNVTRQFTSEFAAGMSVRYYYQNWNWTDPQGVGGRSPWTSINTPALGMNFSYSPAPDWRIGFAPTVEWSGESGTGTGGTATYGAVMSVAHTFSSDLTLGVGAGVFRQIDENKVFPYLLVNWKITDKLRLGNSLPAGPAGGAGLELSYALTDRLLVGVGGAYRVYRFRLNDNGPVPNGIGQNSLVPIFGRVSYQFDTGTRLDLYGAATTGGRLSTTDNSGNTVYSENYKTGLAIALTLSQRF